MSIHLVGGGNDPGHHHSVYGQFVREALAHATANGRTAARIGILVVHEAGDEPEAYHRFAGILDLVAPVEPIALLVVVGDRLPSGRLAELDGLLVAGGLTPAYLEAVADAAVEINGFCARGLPYLGFSAGAAIASGRALVGGWRIDDVAVCHEDNGEGLDEVTVVDGLGLFDLTVDVHAVQWGNLARLMSAVRSGRVSQGVAIDENTALVIDGDAYAVYGAGQVWWVRRSGEGELLVGTERGGISPAAAQE